MSLGDKYWGNVELLLHLDGANGGTTFTDVSKNGYSLSRGGSTVTSTAQSQFGGASAYFDGAGDWLVVPDSSNFNLGTGDFTIECFIYPETGFSSTGGTIYGDLGNSMPWLHIQDTTNYLRLYCNGQYVTSSSAVTFDTWQHIAVSRNSGTVKMYFDGVQKASASFTHNLSTTNDLGIGGERSSASRYYKGYIDEFRLTKGVGRYPSAFTAPTEPFPNSPYQGMPVKDNSLRQPLKVNGNTFIHRSGI